MVADWTLSPSLDGFGSGPCSPGPLDLAPHVHLDCSSPHYRSYFLSSLEMPGQPKPKAKPAAPKAPTQTSFSFITANNPDQFKDKAVMRKVRKAVMHNFLDEAKNDPNSTDVRVRNKRASAVNTPPHNATTQSAPPPLDYVPPPAVECRFDQHIENLFPTVSASSTPAVTAKRDSAVSDEKLIPTFQQPQSPSADPTSFATSSLPTDWAGCISFVKYIKEAQDFFNAYSQAKDRRDRGHSPDPFASCEPLPSSLDLKLLKGNCTKYFGSYAMAKQWVPLQLKSREAFLGSLCISAPYTDLMSLNNSDSRARPDSQQTLEILDILPRMIGLTLNDPVARSSDSNFVAILQLFCGELTSQYTDMLAWHPSVLKMLVNERGGLEKLGGKGVIASNITITSLEANVLQNQSADALYTSWAESYIAKKPFQRQLAPEGPLFTTTQGMKSFAEHKWCLPQTLDLVSQMHNLTETFLRLGRLEAEWTTEDGSNKDQEREKANLRNNIRAMVDRVHDLPVCHPVGEDNHASWIYETIRLTAQLYARAIWTRKPFHEAWKQSCSSSKPHHPSDAQNPCHVTPEMIQKALDKTPMFKVWDRLAGVLYWVLMVSASACYMPPTGTSSEDNSPAAEHHGSTSAAQEILRRKSLRTAGTTSLSPLVDQQDMYYSRQHYSPGEHNITAEEFRDIMTTVQSTMPVTAGVPYSFSTSASENTTSPYQLGSTAVRASSPDSIASILADQGASRNSWSSTTYSGQASGSHTPSPPSSVPSSVSGIPSTENLTSTFPSASTFDFSSFYTPTISAGTVNSNPFAQPSHSDFDAFGALSTDESVPSWDHMYNMFLIGNPMVQQQMDQQYLNQQQQAPLPPSPQPMAPSTDSTDRNKRSRRAPIATARTNEEQAREHRAFVKRYLTANAVRVSILLRFEHTVAVVDGLHKLVQCQKFLNRS